MRRTPTCVLITGLLLSASMALTGMLANATLGQEAQEDGSGPWTVFVYLDGDNNLEGYAIDDLLEMEQVGSKNGVTIIVLLDTLSLTEDTHWLVIEEDVSHYDVETGELDCDCDLFPEQSCPEEVDMGDGNKLTWAVVTAFTYAPAENYMLVLWDHGGGWRGVCYDDSTILDCGWVSRLTTPETAASLATAQVELKKLDENYKLTILGYDACLNSMIEVIYENRNIADYMFASINLVPGPGMGYAGFLSVMTQSPRPTVEEVGKAVVDSYVDCYENLISETGQGLEYFGDTTLSFVQLGERVGELVNDIDALARELFKGGYLNDSRFRGAIESAESQTPRIPTYEGEHLPFVDLGLYADLLGQKIPELSSLTDKIEEGVDEVVVYERHVTSAGGGILRTTGISIYFTCSYYWINPAYWFEDIEDAELYGLNTVYYGMAFTVDTLWDEMVFTFTQAYDESVLDFET
ncbi:MAG: clostripain-related cysteine peptidase [Thermoplasmata archaeon]|nr:clostripain-related cysteine peptidase [Thermoplasmata archaeon]